MKVSGGKIAATETRDIQGTKYQMYSGGSLSKGDELKMTVQPGGGGAVGGLLTSGVNNNLLIGGAALAAALGVILLTAGIALIRRRQAESLPAQGPINAQGDMDESEESLMDAILALDDLYKDGKLPEDAYRQRRTELKNRLKRMMGGV
jgi:hypothetical protein